MVPPFFVELIAHANDSSIISFLVSDRVFRNENKINYNYDCLKCGFRKMVTRQYEDYSRCENCRSNFVKGVPFLKENHCNKINLDAGRIVERMEHNHYQYFGKYAANIVDIKWRHGRFITKFVCGDEVVDSSPLLSLAKAAVLSPFLWDTRYNWRNNIKNDRSNDLQLSHLIMQWGF